LNLKKTLGILGMTKTARSPAAMPPRAQVRRRRSRGGKSELRRAGWPLRRAETEFGLCPAPAVFSYQGHVPDEHQEVEKNRRSDEKDQEDAGQMRS